MFKKIIEWGIERKVLFLIMRNKKKIDSMLKGLEADVKASKQRLGQAQDAVMRKSLNLNTEVDCAVQLGSVVVFI